MAEIAKQRGAELQIWDLYEEPLPIVDPRYHDDPTTDPSPEVRRLAALAQEADAIVIATPVFHGSFSGATKNAIDCLDSRQFGGKPVALVSNGGERSGVQPCDQLRIVVRSLGGVAIPTQVVTIPSDFELRQGSYSIVNRTIQKRFADMVDELLTFAVMLRQLR
jgi:NAD(P)H-dependent FMN reductase